MDQGRIEKASAGPGALANALEGEREGDGARLLLAWENCRPFLET
jgi:hypothetical protein